MKRKRPVIHFLFILLALDLLAGYKISSAAPPDSSKTVMVSTLAGNDPTDSEAGGGFADGLGSNALFAVPIGITIDEAGNLYVADAGNKRIRKLVFVTNPASGAN